MARSQETFNKKDKEKKRLKKRQEKQLKKEERRANSNKGAGLESMLAYVDENGHLTDTPPDVTKKKKEIKAENIELGVPKKEVVEDDVIRKGKVAFFDTSKGYGFIRDLGNEEKYFVHISGTLDEIGENDSVTFELEKGMKGLNAVRVKKT
ncbi:MAG: cold shock domain-containing protein [Flavobacteriales bacterium]|jgi:cold shock CspA family protein|nr:cold shock domain-containing protein [Flavobacteriales bacterium]